MLLALSPAVMVTAPSAEAFTPSAAATTLYEYQIINAINAQRARYGLGRVWLTPCPTRFADVWADYLRREYLRRGMEWRHQSMYPILNGCRASVAAENLGRGYVNPDVLVAAWMASPGHRKNILDGRLNRIGVSAVFYGGQWTVVSDYARF
jgi:uncharacterized protein YkwD